MPSFKVTWHPGTGGHSCFPPVLLGNHWRPCHSVKSKWLPLVNFRFRTWWIEWDEESRERKIRLYPPSHREISSPTWRCVRLQWGFSFTLTHFSMHLTKWSFLKYIIFLVPVSRKQNMCFLWGSPSEDYYTISSIHGMLGHHLTVNHEQDFGPR